MHSIDDTVNPIHKRPGWCDTLSARAFVSARLCKTSGTLCVVIANEVFDADESDLGMT